MSKYTVLGVGQGAGVLRAAPSNSWRAILCPILVVQIDNLVRPRIWNDEDKYPGRVSLVKLPTALFERG